MPTKPFNEDLYSGLSPLPDLIITEKAGKGGIGSVYKAVRKSNTQDIFACKIIPEKKLKPGWERELEKIALLKGVPNIAQYHWSGTALDNNHRPFTYILFDFIHGINLRQYLESPPFPLDLAFIESIAKTILEILHACRAVGVQHGDLHEGNIMISEPDSRFVNSPRLIYVCDFGYGGSHNEIQPKDDFRQFFSIISNLIKRLDPHNLNPRDKVMREKIDGFLQKRVLEIDPTQKHYVGNHKSLIEDFYALKSAAERESASGKIEVSQEPGDYLQAENLGHRVDEWKSLFVPEFLAAQDLLSRNITVLTGARGCGKTMAFSRLTAFMDKVIGEPSGVKGSDQFIGFYLNCRNLVEAFPWLPRKLNKSKKEQIIHYFHLAWFSEFCKTLAIYKIETDEETFEWLDSFLTRIFNEKYNSLPKGADVLSHTRAFLEDEKERCRLGKAVGSIPWPLARIDFLDLLQTQLESNVSWIGEKTLYLFLDDYTIPIVEREVQRTLNPIIFKRRSKLFFKVSTEAANSFEREGLHGKPLELHQDFELIDLATESLHESDKTKSELLEKIFRPRIDRHPILKGKNLGLVDVLGTKEFSNNALAKQLRDNVQKSGGRSRVWYYGVNAFVGMWASDIRIMIQMFADMLREANGSIKKGKDIDKTIQDKVYRAAGGEFLTFTESVTNPSLWDKTPSTRPGEPYGKHLRDIAEAFINISRYELTKGNLISNQGRENPKQAFRLEIIDKFELPDEINEYYNGLVRWHLFLQDWRGKSVRGMITPRLYLNRVLIPLSELTFSRHDHIQLTNEEFIILLKTPAEFSAYWFKKRANQKKGKKKQATLF